MSTLARLLDLYEVRFNPDRGGDQLVLCPVHDERRPSCSVNLDKGLFNCKSCGARGDAIDLVKLKEGLDFASAKRFCEESAGGLDDSVRGQSRPSRRVPEGSGFRPRYRGSVPPRRHRPDF